MYKLTVYYLDMEGELCTKVAQFEARNSARSKAITVAHHGLTTNFSWGEIYYPPHRIICARISAVNDEEKP